MLVQRAGWRRVPRYTARRRSKAVCGGRSALSVVCAGDVVIFLTGLLLLRLQRPFVRAVQVRVVWRVLCEVCVCVPWPWMLAGRGEHWVRCENESAVPSVLPSPPPRLYRSSRCSTLASPPGISSHPCIRLKFRRYLQTTLPIPSWHHF